ncbi:hypothetical protein EM595_2961 [Duffyella gerundensis]|uniref:Uncharacterized protein n=1 Tax=Duffyella gerundensis TaxID=1619313 RepID=A0A0U5L772_9GAMM|nr:hypothetical protein EM595_2961 [Duffyella gerundensis]
MAFLPLALFKGYLRLRVKQARRVIFLVFVHYYYSFN